MDALDAYIAMDRRQALANGQDLPDRTTGTALFADISGFSLLTDALVKKFGPKRAVEELTSQLNLVYDALIAEVHRFGGSVIGFVGDAITCWFDQDQGLQATTCGLVMHEVMEAFKIITLPSGEEVSIVIKIGVASGPVRRFRVGNVQIQYMDVLAGTTLRLMSTAEKLAEEGEVLLSQDTVAQLGDQLNISEWRTHPETEEQFAVIADIKTRIPATPWPELPAGVLNQSLVQPWLLAPVYDRLRRGQDQFLAELRPAVSLFLKFEGLDYDQDQAAGEKLDAYIRWVQQTLVHYEGSLIQLTIGDKGSFLYAAFGAPLAHDDDPVHAVAAALDLITPPSDLDFITATQIGLGRGQARVGAYGSQTRRSYGVIGDEAILGHRLMVLAGPGQICCDYNTYRAASNHFIFDLLPSVRIKGKTGLIRVYQPLAKTDRQLATLQSRPVSEQSIIGREAEVAQLEAKVKSAAQGQGQFILIEGEAGIGKSRLTVELVRLMRQHGLTGLLGTGYTLEQQTSYRAWRDIFMAYFYLNELDNPKERQYRVELRIKEIAPELVDRLPLLNDVLNLGFPESNLTKALNPSLRQQSLISLLLTLLRAWTAERPLVLILEDAHWLDSLSWDLVFHVAQAMTTDQISLLLVVVMRPLEGPAMQPGPRRLGELEHVERMRLKRLNPADTLALAATRLGLSAEDLPAEVGDLICQRAEGNPFFAEELVYALRDQGLIILEPDPDGTKPYRCVISGDLAKAAQTLPETVQDMVLARIDRLPATEQLTLKVASVIGPTFAYPPLYHTLGEHHLINDLTLETQLEDLTALDLTTLEIPEPDLTYAFKHVITREVAYETLLFAQRRQLHRTVAEWYERTHADDLSAYYPLLAHHWSKGEVTLKAIEYLRKAGDVAARMYANAEAIAYYRRALALALVQQAKVLDDKQGVANQQASHLLIALYTCLGHILELSGQFGEALVIYEEMEALGHHRDDQPMVLAALVQEGRVRCTINAKFDPMRGKALAGKALELAQNLGDRAAEAKVLWNVLNLHRYTNRLSQAIEYGERALTLARELDLQELLGAILDDVARCYGVKGRFDRSEALFYEAGNIWRELNNLPMLVDSLASSSTVRVYTGEYEQAIAHSTEALELSHTIGYTWGQSHSQFMIGYAYWDRGEIDRAILALEDSIRLSEKANFLVPQVISRANLAALYSSLGAIDHGLDTIQLALTVDKANNFRTEALTILAELYLRQGDLEQAQAALDESRQSHKQAVFPIISTFGVFTEVELLIRQEDYAQAKTRTDMLLADLRQSGMWAHIPATLHFQGQILLALSQREAAYKHLIEAQDAAEAIGSMRILHPILITLSEIETDPAQAERLRQQAWSLIAAITDQIGSVELQGSFLNRPYVQRLAKASRDLTTFDDLKLRADPNIV